MTTVTTSPGNAQRYSSNGRLLAYRISGTGALAYNLAAGGAERIIPNTTSLGADTVSWGEGDQRLVTYRPDGSGDSDIVSVTLGGVFQDITSRTDANFHPDWHPGDRDIDLDGVLDWQDNCVTVANPSQEDLDGNGAGDACQCDVSVNLAGITQPLGVAWDGQNLWISDEATHTVNEVDPFTGNTLSSFPGPGGAKVNGVSFEQGSGSLWLVSYPSGTLYQVTPAGSVIHSFAGPENYLHGIEQDGAAGTGTGDLWVSDGDLNHTSSLYRLTSTGTVLDNIDTTITFSDFPSDLELINGWLWVYTGGSTSALHRVDPTATTGMIQETFPLPECAGVNCGVAWDGACLWVAHGDTLSSRPLR
jgi:hypothetical protein